MSLKQMPGTGNTGCKKRQQGIKCPSIIVDIPLDLPGMDKSVVSLPFG
jgi:hypothetical protein